MAALLRENVALRGGVMRPVPAAARREAPVSAAVGAATEVRGGVGRSISSPEASSTGGQRGGVLQNLIAENLALRGPVKRGRHEARRGRQ